MFRSHRCKPVYYDSILHRLNYLLKSTVFAFVCIKEHCFSSVHQGTCLRLWLHYPAQWKLQLPCVARSVLLFVAITAAESAATQGSSYIWISKIYVVESEYSHRHKHARVHTHTRYNKHVWRHTHGAACSLLWGKRWTRCARAYLKWGMMMPAKAHDWLSHLDQSLWLVVLLDWLHHASHRFIRFSGYAQVGPIHLSLHPALLCPSHY